jgi:hypothetical protein
MSRARITSSLEALALGSLLAIGGPASCGAVKHVSPEERIGRTIPVTVTVTNGSAQPIEIDLAYPNLLYLRFTSHGWRSSRSTSPIGRCRGRGSGGSSARSTPASAGWR